MQRKSDTKVRLEEEDPLTRALLMQIGSRGLQAITQQIATRKRSVAMR